MINAALEIGATTRDAEAIDRVIRLVEQRGDHVVHRVKLRLLGGLVRPSYAVRLRLFLPFLRWLLAEASESPDMPTTEGTE